MLHVSVLLCAAYDCDCVLLVSEYLCVLLGADLVVVGGQATDTHTPSAFNNTDAQLYLLILTHSITLMHSCTQSIPYSIQTIPSKGRSLTFDEKIHCVKSTEQKSKGGLFTYFMHNINRSYLFINLLYSREEKQRVGLFVQSLGIDRYR